MKKPIVFVAISIICLTGISGGLYFYLLTKEPASTGHVPPANDLERFNLPEGLLSNETILTSLGMSGDYLLSHIQKSGKWDYEYDPMKDHVLSTYNVLRHAGTTYSLALIFKYTRDLDYYNGTVSTLDYLISKFMVYENKGGVEIGYMQEDGLVKLGGAALALLAIVEVEKMDPEANYDREMNALGNFVLMMHQDSGRFLCFYKLNEDQHNDFYPGEALLALSRLYDHTKDTRYLDALELGLGYYNEYYKAGSYTAYTPWATEANVYAYGWLKNESYMDICYRMAQSCASGQWTPETAPDPLYIGGFSPEPASNLASRMEGVVDSYLLAKREGDTAHQDEFLPHIQYTALVLMNLQFNETDVTGMPDPDDALGGMPLNYSDLTIRIDYVQHAVVVLAKILRYQYSTENV